MDLVIEIEMKMFRVILFVVFLVVQNIQCRSILMPPNLFTSSEDQYGHFDSNVLKREKKSVLSQLVCKIYDDIKQFQRVGLRFKTLYLFDCVFVL